MRVLLILALLWMFGPMVCKAGSSDSRYDKAARSRLGMLTTNQTNVQWLQSVTNLPTSIREKLGSVADVGQPFSKTCTGSDPHLRFLIATKQGTQYTVAVEQGGYAYFWFATQYVLDDKGTIMRETRIEPDGAANGSQPIRSVTNSTSSAAGSRR